MDNPPTLPPAASPTHPQPTFRHWSFTVNNWTQPQLDTLVALYTSGIFHYLVARKEVTKCLGGCFALATPLGLNALRDQLALPDVNLEVMGRTFRESRDYCKKGDFVEYGKLPTFRTGLIEAKRKAREGDLDSIPAEYYIKHYVALKRIKIANRPTPPDLNWVEPPNVWFYGPTGTGKSLRARLQYPGAYWKMLNKWWDNYDDEDVVLIESIGLSHASSMSRYLKTWVGRQGFLGEMKHQPSSVLRPKIIVVTSNYSIEELWPNQPQITGPLLQRFNQILMDVPYSGSFNVWTENAKEVC